MLRSIIPLNLLLEFSCVSNFVYDQDVAYFKIDPSKINDRSLNRSIFSGESRQILHDAIIYKDIEFFRRLMELENISFENIHENTISALGLVLYSMRESEGEGDWEIQESIPDPIPKRPLLEYVEMGLTLILKGADVNKWLEVYGQKYSLLMLAVKKGFLNFSMFLVKHGALCSDQDYDGRNALYYALKSSDSNSQLCRLLFSNSGQITNREILNELVLSYSALNKLFKIQILHAHDGANFSFVDPVSRETPLLAVLDGNCPLECIQYIMNIYSGPFDAANQYGSTPFSKALKLYKRWIRSKPDEAAGMLDVFRYLLQRSSPSFINSQKDSGETFLMETIRLNLIEAFRILIENSANIDMIDSEGRNALYYAFESETKASDEMTKILLEYNASISEPVQANELLFSLGVLRSAFKLDLLRQLFNPNFSHIDDQGNTVLDQAISEWTNVPEESFKIILDLLEPRLLNRTDSNETLPLVRLATSVRDYVQELDPESYARIIQKMENVFETMLYAGADPNLVDSSGMSAMSVAESFPELRDILTAHGYYNMA